jgi:hypothetical protein
LAAIGHFDEIRPSDVRKFAEWLASHKAAERGRGARTPHAYHDRPTRTMTAYPIRAHLFALSVAYPFLATFCQTFGHRLPPLLNT